MRWPGTEWYFLSLFLIWEKLCCAASDKEAVAGGAAASKQAAAAAETQTLALLKTKAAVVLGSGITALIMDCQGEPGRPAACLQSEQTENRYGTSLVHRWYIHGTSMVQSTRDCCASIFQMWRENCY